MSPYELIRQFKAVFGQTPHVYRTRERLEQARQLLLTGKYSVTEVCFEVGFSSLGSFSTLFTQHVGMAPSVYRRTVRRRKEPHNCFAMMYAPRNFREASDVSPC